MILDNIVWEISQWVLVSTYKKFLLLNESRSRHPAYISVSTSTKYPSLIESLSQEKQNKRNLIQLDKFYQNQFIFPTWNCWVSPVGEKKSRPTNLAIVIGPVLYRIYFMVHRSLPFPVIEGQISAKAYFSRAWYIKGILSPRLVLIYIM